MGQKYTRTELRSYITDYYDRNSRLPKTSDIISKENFPDRNVFVRHTGVNRWVEVFDELNIDDNLIDKYKQKNNYSDVSKKELVQELQDYREEYNKSPTTTELDNNDNYHNSYYFYPRFDGETWDDILEEAELESNTISKEDIESDIRRLYDELGVVPKKKHIQEYGEYSYTTYIKHFENSLHNLHTSMGYKSTRIKDDEISDDELIDDIVRIGDKLDKIPSYDEIIEHTKYTKYLYRKRFGKITEAREKAGFNSDKLDRNLISDEELLSELKYVCNLCGHSPKQDEFNEHSKYSSSVYTDRFGGLGNALEKIGYNPNVYYNVSECELISDIQNINDKLDRIPRFEDLKKYSKYSMRHYRLNFKNHNSALEAAGINIDNICYNRISDEALINELQILANELGRTPKKKELMEYSEYSADVYVSRFGGFGAAVLKAGLEPNNGHGVPKEELLSELNRVGDIVGGSPSAREIRKHSKYGTNIYKSNFGSLMNAREKAGLNRYVSATWIEKWAYNILDDMGVSFDKEVYIGNYRVDLVVDEGINAPYALELDGDYYHKEVFKNHPAEGNLEHQSERDKFINDEGYHVIRVWESDIDNNEEEVRNKLHDIFIGEIKPPDSGEYIDFI